MALDTRDQELAGADRLPPVMLDFRAVYDTHVRSVRRFLGDLLRDDAGADEATQETFVRAHAKLSTLQDGDKVLPWLFGIARNVARESARRNEVETRARRRLGLPTDFASEDGYAAVEERLSPRAALAEALETLPEHEREALELRVVNDLPYSDVAARLGVRPAAARLRVSRALRRLSALPLKEDT